MNRFVLALILPALFMAACSRQESAPPPARDPATLHLVESATVRNEQVAATVERTGSLRAQREIKILSQEEGRIVAVPFYAGDAVQRGDLLLQLDDVLLAAELRKIEAQRKQLELDLGRLERLQGNQLISDDELARARTALDVAMADELLLKTRLGYTRITAPFAGVISVRLAEPGDVVPRFNHLLTLTDLQSLVTSVSVSELVLPLLATGDTVQVQIDALGASTHRGRILRIHPAVDAATRQGTVEVALSPVPVGARPGQLCRVQFMTRPQSRAVVPFAALRRDAEGEFVFVIGADGKVQRSAVVSGMQLGDKIELLSGPPIGSSVVIKGFLGLSPGLSVKSVSDGGATP